jgi:predicted nucleotidyltransferase
MNNMRLEHYPVEKLKKEIIEIVGRHLDLSEYRVFFFGSRVEGKGDERSDIDIGIEGPSELSGRILGSIKEDIDRLPTLYKIEIVDFKRVSSDFREVALQNVELIL